jgi:hypothetical protein
VTAGFSTTFAVIAGGTSPLSYQWTKGGAAIAGAIGSSLTIATTAASDAGNYAVVVTNVAGTVTSAFANLSVATPVTTFAVKHLGANSQNTLWSYASGSGTMVAVGNPGLIYSSSNGTDWTQRASGTTDWLVGVAFGNGLFVAVGDQGKILKSTNGSTWVYASDSGTTQRLNAIIHGGGKWVAVGESGAIVTSLDGDIWKPAASGVSNFLHGLAYGAGYYVTTGGGGTILVSSDGLKWVSRAYYTTADLEACVFVNNYFMAAGANGECLTASAPSGALFWYNDPSQKPATSSRIRGLAAGPGVIIAVTEDGAIFSTPSLFNKWSPISNPSSNPLLAAGFGNDTFFALGFGELILRSDPVYDGRLGNLSTRALTGTGSNVLITGFVIRGEGSKQMLIRAAGPALSGFGVPGVLTQPTLSLYNGAGDVVASNTGWSSAPNVAAIRSAAASVGAFAFGEGSSDSALVVTLSPGSYTAITSGVGGNTGTTLIENYDLDNLTTMKSRLVNISSRGVVGTGQNIMIPGIVVGGATARLLLIRAVGPTLGGFGVDGTLSDPVISVVRSVGASTVVVASNDDWEIQDGTSNFRGSDVGDYGKRAGAFPLAAGSKDAGLLFTTATNTNYTVLVSGANGATGVTLVEVYDVTGL